MDILAEDINAALICMKGKSTVSYSTFIRELRIGFVKAHAIMNELENMGMVGPQQPDGVHEVWAGGDD